MATKSKIFSFDKKLLPQALITIGITALLVLTGYRDYALAFFLGAAVWGISVTIIKR